jgi:tetratricopeptide (TPR) repeat protein
MKKKIALIVLTSVVLALGAMPAWSQATLARVGGKITDNGKPVPDAQIIYTSVNNGKSIKTKTDKNGDYLALGFAVDDYKIEVKSAAGELLFSVNKFHVEFDNAAGGANVTKNIDLTKDRTGGTGAPLMTKEQMDAIKQSNAKAANINALISQAQNALNAKNWAEAVPPLQQMIEADPKRWEFFQALGNAQFNLAQYQESIDTNDKGVAAAEAALADPGKADPKTEGPRIKAAMGQMLAMSGNAHIKLKENDKAIASFEKAASLDPNPAVAYFNLCATQYNMNQMKAAAMACDKAIAADPNKADAYFIKGSALYGDGTMDANNKYVVPPGTGEALNKYLELAPDGAHAGDVKAMLQALGVPIETKFGANKKKGK